MYDTHCQSCHGLIMNPNRAYGYVGPVCHCGMTFGPIDRPAPIQVDIPDFLRKPDMQNAAPKVDAPRVTVDRINSKIRSAEYVRHGLTTICFLTLENGFKVSGESACVSAENYNQALGEKYAHEAAFDKIWMLEGYLLKEELYRSDLK